uniref:Peptidase M13 N-terminal domain-containing protein n=1 Tax=Panagrolaimus superbus TaxID=310955 RepID=A0A914Y9C0_9BILA
MLKKSKQKITVLLVLISLITVFAVAVNGDASSNGISNIYPNSPSHTEAYQQAAKFFEASIDTSVNPCDDFYQYSCGKFNDSMSFDAIFDKVNQDVTDALNSRNDKDVS